MEIDKYFKIAIKEDASDVHLIGGEFPSLRFEGEIRNIEEEKIDNKELEIAIMSILSKKQQDSYKKIKELDFAYVVDKIRFRINLHQQTGGIGLSARLIPNEIPTPEDLHFEEGLLEIPKLLDGLVLITGPTGCGKSTTIASLIEEVNKKRKSHIVTVEDPIEFLFHNKKSLIEQREVGADTDSFASALKHVLRQDPDVIFIGEMRDPETIVTALTAAETGHLVFSTLHTNSASEAIERIVDVFEGPKQKQILIQLASVLRVVASQQLVPAKDGGRVPAREILINNSAISNLIRENHISQIKSTIQTGAKDGMVTMENSLKALVKEGWIGEEIAASRGGKLRKI